MNTLPPLFISHGSPMTALEPRQAGAFWQRLGPAIDATFGRPKAILVVSAHTLTRVPALLAGARHEAIYDFGGFDPKLQTLRYDAPGAPALAARVQGLAQAGVKGFGELGEAGLACRNHQFAGDARLIFAPDGGDQPVDVGWLGPGRGLF